MRRALLLKKLEFELREPSGPEDYRRWSPVTGLLPVLEVDGERVHDSTAILYRIDELFPQPALLAPDPKVAEQQRQLEDWADESFLFYFNQWLRRRAEEPLRRRGWIARVRTLQRLLAWLRAGGTWERPETALVRKLGDRLDDLVNLLGTRPFFHARRLSMADLAVYGMLTTMGRDFIPGTRRLLADRPSLVEFMRRVENETGDEDLSPPASTPRRRDPTSLRTRSRSP